METCNLEALLGYIEPSQNTKDWECNLMVEYLSSIHRPWVWFPTLSSISQATETRSNNHQLQYPLGIISYCMRRTGDFSVGLVVERILNMNITK